MQRILDEYRYCVEDVATVKRADALNADLTHYREELNYLDTFIEAHLCKVCDVLLNRGFVVNGGSGSGEEVADNDALEWSTSTYQLTPLGTIAAGIAEIHPLIAAHWLKKWEWFRDFTFVQIIGLIACFSDVKISEQHQRFYPWSEDPFIKARTQELFETYIEYEDWEINNKMNTGIVYTNALNFVMPDFTMEWCDCIDETACKMFIQGRIAEIGISVGDFTKAMLKISTIAKEWSAVAESAGEIACVYKLSKIDGMILKYITTSQSLYV